MELRAGQRAEKIWARLAVRDAAVVQQLQQDVEHVRVGLLHLRQRASPPMLQLLDAHAYWVSE